ncbi:MAG: tetratricopeptide repeat protein [Thermoanaerobaculia bacterium]
MDKAGKKTVPTATELAQPLALQDDSDLVPLLRLLARAEGFALAFVKCNVLPQRERLVDVLSQSLKAQGRSGRRLDLHEPVVDLLEEILRLSPPLVSEDVLFVLGFERSIPAEVDFPPALVKLNLVRERFRNLPCPLVIVLPDYALTQLARQAPDFWAWRSGVFEVSVQTTELATIFQREVSLSDRDLQSLSPERIRGHLDILREVLAEYEVREHSESERLSLSMQIAADLRSLGELERAQTYAERALDLARKLRDLPAEAKALDLLAVVLTDLGHYEEALGVARQAVEAFRALAREEEPGPSEGLAMSLSNLGRALGSLKHSDEALGAVEEAVKLRRRLVARHPKGLPQLASALNILGIVLGDLGRREEAIAAMSEAVEVRRHLSAENPDRFLPDLAASLSNLASGLRDVGRRETALSAAKEAVEISRRLAMKRSETLVRILASSLNNLGIILNDQGRREEALQVTEEAVQLSRNLCSSRSVSFLPGLATSLNNLAAMLGARGHFEKALQAAREAVGLSRRLSSSYPDVFLPDLGSSLSNLGEILRELGNKEEALQSIEEGIRVLTPFFLNNPAAFQKWIDNSVARYRNLCAEMGIDPDLALLHPILRSLPSDNKAGPEE